MTTCAGRPSFPNVRFFYIIIHKKGLTAHDELLRAFEPDTAPVVEKGGGGLAGLREAIARLLAVSK